MERIRAAVTMIRPPANAGYDCDHTGYHQCQEYPGVPKQGGRNEIICDDNVIGEIVYLYMTNKYHLQVCEVEVYGFRKFLL